MHTIISRVSGISRQINIYNEHVMRWLAYLSSNLHKFQICQTLLEDIVRVSQLVTIDMSIDNGCNFQLHAKLHSQRYGQEC